MNLSEIIGLAYVFRSVEQLPTIGVERGARHVERRGGPAIAVDRPIPEALIVLLSVERRLPRVVKNRCEAGGNEWFGRETVALGWQIESNEIDQRRQDAGYVGVLIAHNGIAAGPALWPTHDKGHRVGASVGVALVEPEGSVAGHGPAAGIVRHRGGTTELVHARHHLLGDWGHTPGKRSAEVAVCTVGASFTGCSVVAGEDEDRVVELADGLKLGR